MATAQVCKCFVKSRALDECWHLACKAPRTLRLVKGMSVRRKCAAFLMSALKFKPALPLWTAEV